MKKIEIKLTEPVEINGEHFEQLSIRPPRVRDLLMASKFDGSDEEKEVRIFANLCEVPPEVIEELTIKDYQQLQKAYQGFLS